MIRKCYLKCLQSLHDPIELPHGREITIGRSKKTKIRDQKCSRKQVSITANCDTCTVEIKHIGVHPSGFDGFAMSRGEAYNVPNNTIIEILLNDYKHIIKFDPPPDDYQEPKISKRKLSEVDSDDSNDSDDSIQADKKCKIDDKNPQLVPAEATEDKWEQIEQGSLYIFTSKGVLSKNKIAAFDMDGTIIKTKSGKVHPIDINDWVVAFLGVAQKLKELINDNFKIVIFSNQAPIGNGRVKIDDFKVKIHNLIQKLNVPIQVFLATGKDFFRKPMTGMWDTLVKEKNDNIDVDLGQSFYCGDAAGRVNNWAPGKKKDHSMADKLFAENIKIKFYTPEQFFLGHSITNVLFSKPEFNPIDISMEPFNEDLISNAQEILVLVGYPGSGKSFLAKQIEKRSKYEYVTVCRDKLGSWQKCASEAAKYLQQRKSVIVDSTNPDIESRARWTALAQEHKVQCRCANMSTSFAHARHNNKFREIMKMQHLPVNDIVFHSYKKKYVAPKPSEGFKEVIEVKFSPNFESEDAEKKYKMHLLEK